MSGIYIVHGWTLVYSLQTICNSLTLSIPALNLLFHISLPPQTLFLSHGWFHELLTGSVSSEHNRFLFSVVRYFTVFGCVHALDWTDFSYFSSFRIHRVVSSSWISFRSLVGPILYRRLGLCQKQTTDLLAGARYRKCLSQPCALLLVH